MAAARLLSCIALLVLLARSARAGPPADEIGPPGSGSLVVDVRGMQVSDDAGRFETLAMVVLSVPLDRFVMPVRAPARHDGKLAQDAGDAGGSSGSRPAAPEREARAPIVRLVSPELARAAVRAALRASGSSRSRARLESLESRARSSAALPELRLRAARSTDETLRLTPTETDPYRYTQAGGATLLFEARVGWKLDRLVFADEEIAVERLRRERSRSDAEIAVRVLRLLFDWQRAMLRSADPEGDPEARSVAAIRAIEAEVELDVLTGGWFTLRLRQAEKPARKQRAR